MPQHPQIYDAVIVGGDLSGSIIASELTHHKINVLILEAEYDDLENDYERAEREIGVSGEVSDQREHGLKFRRGYVYPMEAIPQSYLDTMLKEQLKTLRVFGKTLKVRSTPQGPESACCFRYFPQAQFGNR